MKTIMLKGFAIAILLTAGGHVFAGEETLDIDTKFRAKIAMEKVKQAAIKRESDKREAEVGGIDNASCGAQNIGNVDTGGRPGAAPREVFVFAPNAINLVSAGGCR